MRSLKDLEKAMESLVETSKKAEKDGHKDIAATMSNQAWLVICTFNICQRLDRIALALERSKK